MLIEKKDVDTYLGMLPDGIMSQCMGQFGYLENDWIVLPFININQLAMAINRRSETARKAIIMTNEQKKLVLKEIPWYCSSERFADYELTFQMRLRELGFSIPKIHETKQGKLYCKVNYDGSDHYIFAQDFEIGESWKATNIENSSIAIALAKFQKLCKAICHEMIIFEPPRSNVFELAQKMLDVAKTNIVEKYNNHVEIENYYDYAVNKINQYKKEAIEKGYFESVMPVHGDFNPWNLIFSSEGTVLAVIDFDNSIIDNPIHDLCEALVDICVFNYKPNTTRFQGIPTNINTERAQQFIEVYKKNEGIVDYELIPCVAATITIELIALAIARFDYDYSDIQKLYDVDDMVYYGLKG